MRTLSVRMNGIRCSQQRTPHNRSIHAFCKDQQDRGCPIRRDFWRVGNDAAYDTLHRSFSPLSVLSSCRCQDSADRKDSECADFLP